MDVNINEVIKKIHDVYESHDGGVISLSEDETVKIIHALSHLSNKVKNLGVLDDVIGSYSENDLKTSFNEGQSKKLTGQSDDGDQYEDEWFQFEDWFKQWKPNDR